MGSGEFGRMLHQNHICCNSVLLRLFSVYFVVNEKRPEAAEQSSKARELKSAEDVLFLCRDLL